MSFTKTQAVGILAALALVFGAAISLRAQDAHNHEAEAGKATAETHDHETKAADPVHEHEAEAGHDHAAHAGEADAHAGHDHEGEGHTDEVTLTDDAMKQFGVVVEAVGRQSLRSSVSAPARVEFNREAMAHVGTPLEGRVAEIKARLGDSFAKGDVVLVLDSPQFGEAQSDYLQKRSAVDAAKASAEVARIQFERAEKLREGNGINVTDFLQRQGDVKKSESEVKVAEAAARAAENRLHIYGFSEDQVRALEERGEVGTRFEIRAPISGKVIQREVTQGEVVGPDRDALLVMADTSTLWALVDVPEKNAGQLSIGGPATIEVEALNGMKFPGTIAYVSPELNRQTRTLQARVEIRDGNTPLHPGMFARAHLSLSSADGADVALAIPDSAVLIVEGEPAVFAEVADEPGTYSRRPVKTGAGNGVFLPLLGGLAEGERIVVQGAFLLKAELAKGEMEGKSCSGH